MIRVKKSDCVPSSLVGGKRYDGEDVIQQLFSDQHSKCYICERNVDTDFQIEHVKSQKYHPALICDWHNLFLSCNYCNGKKLQFFDTMLNAETEDIEDVIRQTYNSKSKMFEFSSKRNDEATVNTIKFLTRVFNGTEAIKTKREEEFFNVVLHILNSFKSRVIDFLNNENEETFRALEEELSIGSELLGLKYWIVKSNPKLYSVFAESIVWNKH